MVFILPSPPPPRPRQVEVRHWGRDLPLVSLLLCFLAAMCSENPAGLLHLGLEVGDVFSQKCWLQLPIANQYKDGGGKYCPMKPCDTPSTCLQDSSRAPLVVMEEPSPGLGGQGAAYNLILPSFGQAAFPVSQVPQRPVDPRN